MVINRISILNFKNITETGLTFSPKINYLFGNNGMGKTNLMDALYYLSFTKSHTNLPDSRLIKQGAGYCVLQGFYTVAGGEEEIRCGFKLDGGKTFRRNKKEYERMSDHIGLIPLVMISPADSRLIRGGSEERRKFIDMVISQYDKEYLRTLIRYNRTLQQRNALLRDDISTVNDPLLDVLDLQLASGSRMIHARRSEFTEKLIPVFKEYYGRISGGGETIDLRYESQLNDNDVETLISSRREQDRRFGFTGVGVHKDDLQFIFETGLVRKVGSEGQNKTCLIAIKLAQFHHLAGRGSVVPILLLDDIFDSLDASRSEQTVRLASNLLSGQVFITGTSRRHLDGILPVMDRDYKIFHVEDGKISES
ncbi:MAG: DNA replication/repair protein RecF [Dysgonamonadaceae bacterium]|jgi:DNA replication and repair protein RecF|nr:DNA replication/repair protein RecF [Dysgonamonadaceae bacterium]